RKPTSLELADRGAIKVDGASTRAARATITLQVREDETLPFRLAYAHAGGGRGGWKVTWSWGGAAPGAIPASALFFDEHLAAAYHWEPDPDPATIDFSRFATVAKRDVIVFHEPGRAAAWPANQGF